MTPHHFDVEDEPSHRQFLAWRDRVGHVIDVLPQTGQVGAPFRACIDRYQIGDSLFTDCTSDALVLERSIARISTDSKRDFVFHVFADGGMKSMRSFNTYDASTSTGAGIVAFDLGQPVRMTRGACRVWTLFVPHERIEALYPHSESLHGRVFEHRTPLTQLLTEQVASLARDMPDMSTDAARNKIENCTQLLVAAFSRQANLSGDARAAVRAAMFDRARRFIQEHLHQSTLTPESVLDALGLTRPSLYRLFEHEGGVAAYIRNQRLREAADELIKFPNLSVLDISYGLGFKSASDFARAFRRRYEMSPQEMRERALERLKSAGAATVERW